MKFKHVNWKGANKKVFLIFIVIVSSCNIKAVEPFCLSQENKQWVQLLHKFDEAFYSLEEEMNFSENPEILDKLLKKAIRRGYKRKSFIKRTNEVKSLYANILKSDLAGEIWAEGPSSITIKGKVVVGIDLRIIPSETYLKLLESISVYSEEFNSYYLFFKEQGFLLTNKDILRDFMKMDKTDCEIRLAFYLHVITWLSRYPD